MFAIDGGVVALHMNVLSEVHLLNATFSKVVQFGPRSTVVMDVPDWKAYCFTVLILLKVTEVMLLAFLNALADIVVISGRLIFPVIAEQFSKALFPIVVTPDGRVAVTRDLQLQKAELSMVVKLGENVTAVNEVHALQA